MLAAFAVNTEPLSVNVTCGAGDMAAGMVPVDGGLPLKLSA